MQFNQELDARGLNCPLPILRCKKGMAEIGGGEVLKVMATDPGSVKDFQAFCKQTGHELLSLEEKDITAASGKPSKEFTFYLRKRSS
ncbi:MAG TPA: sulfurtransferase TusA family protein [Methylophilaceae bacterium]|nr:sulfurtransferase TusA family protein [Methylophilaceae bacterium]